MTSSHTKDEEDLETKDEMKYLRNKR